MLGIEGMPFKYIIIVVVAGLVLVAVVAFISMLTTSLSKSGTEMTGALNESSRGSAMSICESSGCCWNSAKPAGQQCNCTLETNCVTLK